MPGSGVRAEAEVGPGTMCGRYTLSVPLSDLVDVFDVQPPTFEYPLRYNIAPTQHAPVVARSGGSRRLGLLRWGLVPPWAKDPAVGSRMINARSETVADKPAFRKAFERRRCLVPADGFFEWKKEAAREGGRTRKTPYWIHRPSRVPFAFAGLWERWGKDEEDALYTFTILTTEASAPIRHIHSRMPAILSREAADRWIDEEASREELLSLLIPYQGSELDAHPVSSVVNSPRNDTPVCIEPIRADSSDEGSSGP
jgi:putative SOS response-associated peptidase YedK